MDQCIASPKLYLKILKISWTLFNPFITGIKGKTLKLNSGRVKWPNGHTVSTETQVAGGIPFLKQKILSYY